jgi:hypothetical protein
VGKVHLLHVYYEAYYTGTQEQNSSRHKPRPKALYGTSSLVTESSFEERNQFAPLLQEASAPQACQELPPRKDLDAIDEAGSALIAHQNGMARPVVVHECT